ncbi:hypothetical protein WJU23_00320 [Prosthecobacter sp. SYSU 5D2]
MLLAVLVYAIVSIRCEWPLWLTWLCTLLMWYNIHRTVRWTEYDSPLAKQQKQLHADLDKTMNATMERAARERQD